jgi:IclR family pca regulon transcriptional regulator
LHVNDRTDANVVEQSVGTQHVGKVDHTPGSKHPLSRGASGWSILAFQNERLIQRALKASPMPSPAHGTAEERLAKVRAEGFALSHDELQLGVHGLAMPIFNPDGTCEASLGLLVPSSRSETLFGHHAKLAETVRQISEQLATI